MRLLLGCLLFLWWANGLFAQQPSPTSDFKTVAIAPEYDSVSGLHRLLFGKNYRKLWATPVSFRVIHLGKEKGGLTRTGKGGGNQTKSLKFKDKDGREWALRSVQKYPERALPPKLKGTIVKSILQDQVSTGHPFAALTVPVFADALDIPHSNPELVYMPDDTALGDYRKDFANTVLLLEDSDPLGLPETISTEKAQGKLERSDSFRVDERLLLRARLMDHVLGDWDRHEDQWHWAEIANDSQKVFIPVPRDRDKVFYTTSGILPWLLSKNKSKRNLQRYKAKIEDISLYNYNNRYFDRYFFTALNEQDWREEIQYVQQRLTDSVIEKALSRLPSNINKLSGNKIASVLKGRRDNLEKEGMEYYKFLSKKIDIPAADNDQLFEVAYQNDDKLKLDIYRFDSRREGARLYSRTFYGGDTKEIRLYGLGGDDVFHLSGRVPSSNIKVRMIGGAGVDSFSINGSIRNRRRIWIYDRSDSLNKYPATYQAKLRASTDSNVNYFDRQNFKYEKLSPLYGLVLNRDQGLSLRMGITYNKQQFRKEPYAEKHLFTGNYSTVRNSFQFAYSGVFNKISPTKYLTINAEAHGPNNFSTFFGLGNESVFDSKPEDAIEFYRTRIDYVTGNSRLNWILSNHATVNAGIGSFLYSSSGSENKNTFLKVFNDASPDEKVFDKRFYVGAVTGWNIDTRRNYLQGQNKKENLSKGISWTGDVAAMKRLDGNGTSYGRVTSDITFYVPVFDPNIVLANRIGGGTTIGNPIFFQMIQLGGTQNLRGFYNNRFTGKSMLYHNVDLRFKLFDFNSYFFPGTVGGVLFNDIGRVWQPGEHSTKWHQGYGGGIYIIPADVIIIEAILAKSVEGVYPTFSVGFTF